MLLLLLLLPLLLLLLTCCCARAARARGRAPEEQIEIRTIEGGTRVSTYSVQ